VTVEQPSTGLSKPETADHAVEEQLRAEHVLGRAILISVLVAVPINVAVWVGLVAFAVSRAGSALGGPIAMAVVVGLLSGLFFGTWAAFVGKTHLFEEMDRTVDRGKGSSGSETHDTAGRSPTT
jgi:membrane protein implicated in regulation of membrane protease activity